MEKARDGSFVRTTRKTAEDDDDDWDGTLNRYLKSGRHSSFCKQSSCQGFNTLLIS
jgi:hypothetical protein